MRKMKNLIKAAIIFLSIWGNQQSFSQNMIEANPANTLDPGSSFINPAIIIAQHKQVYAGIRVLQLGFLDNNSTAFKHSFVSYSQPFSGLIARSGWGFNAQYLSTPFYSQGNYSFLFAKQLSDIFTLGARTTLFTKGYDLRDANLERQDDPVFAGSRTKYVFSYGFGLLLGPVSNVTVGLAVDHVNKPNLSLSGTPLPQPITFDIGINYMYNNFVGPSFYVNYQDNQTVTTFGVQAKHFAMGTVGLFYGNRSLILDGKLNLLNNRMSIGYRMDLPLMDLISYSVGSHLLSVSYRFSEPIDADFRIGSSVTSLNIIEKRITIIVEKGIRQRDLDGLKNYNLDVFDREALESIKDSAEVVDIHSVGDRTGAQLDDASYKYYKKTVVAMVEEQRRKTGRVDFPVDIDSPPGTGERALALLNFLVDSLGISSKNVKIVYSPNYSNPNKSYGLRILNEIKKNMGKNDSTRSKIEFKMVGEPLLSEDQTIFRIQRLRSSKPVHSWRILIKSGRKTIKRIVGIKEAKTVAWDWKDDDGKLVNEGEYFYTFQWKDKAIARWKPAKPKRRMLIVDKEVQLERITLTRGGRPPASGKNYEMGTEKLEFLLQGKKVNSNTASTP